MASAPGRERTPVRAWIQAKRHARAQPPRLILPSVLRWVQRWLRIVALPRRHGGQRRTWANAVDGRVRLARPIGLGQEEPSRLVARSRHFLTGGYGTSRNRVPLKRS